METDSAPLYEPLHSSTSTRLLRLLPGSGRGPIYAELYEVDLADDPEFEAVSYTWGDDFIVKHVILNGQHKIKVRNNLWTFLQRLRLETQPRILWVDAICISQTDLKEKSQQVGIIGKIFGYAARVLAWVGEHADSSEALFRLWPELTDYCYEIYDGNLMVREGRRRSYEEEIARRRTIWQHFLGRPYFHRTWIVQEIGIAQKILVHCGNDHLEWRDLISSRWYQEQESVRGPIVNDIPLFDGISSYGEPELPISLLWSLDRLRDIDGSRKATDEGIFDLVHRFHETECMDRRDKVYALLSLERRKQGQEQIVADYTQDMAEMVVHVFSQRVIDGGGEDVDFSRFFHELGLRKEDDMPILSLVKRKSREDGAHRDWKALYNHLRRYLDPARRNDYAVAPPVREQMSSSDPALEGSLSASGQPIWVDEDPYRTSDDDILERSHGDEVRGQLSTDSEKPYRETWANRLKKRLKFRRQNPA